MLILSITSSFPESKSTHLDFWSLKNFLYFWVWLELFSKEIRRLRIFSSDQLGERKNRVLAQSGLKLKMDQNEFPNNFVVK